MAFELALAVRNKAVQAINRLLECSFKAPGGCWTRESRNMGSLGGDRVSGRTRERLDTGTMATGTQLEKLASARPQPGQPQLLDQIAALWAGARALGRDGACQRGWAIGAALLLVCLTGGCSGMPSVPTGARSMRMDPETRVRPARFSLKRRSLSRHPRRIGYPGSGGATGQGAPSHRGKGGLKSGRLDSRSSTSPTGGLRVRRAVNYQRASRRARAHRRHTLRRGIGQVHLVMPHDSLFRDQERPAKASVVIKLRHRSLPMASRRHSQPCLFGRGWPDPGQCGAGGCSGLCRWDRRRCGAPVDGRTGVGGEMVSTLEPVTGVATSGLGDPGLRSGASDVTQQTYDPDKTVTLSMQRTEQTTGAQPVAAGVPGRLQRSQHAGAAVYPQQTSPPQSAKTESST